MATMTSTVLGAAASVATYCAGEHFIPALKAPSMPKAEIYKIIEKCVNNSSYAEAV